MRPHPPAHRTAPHQPPSTAAGRFAGPLIIGGVTKIATPGGQTGYCTEWAIGPDGAEDCVGPPEAQCVITGACRRSSLFAWLCGVVHSTA